MKKFLSTLALILTLIIFPAISNAADLPDIRQLSSGINFDEESSDTSEVDADDFEIGCRTYVYTCPVGQESNLLSQYANNLLSTGQFQLIRYYTETANGTDWYIVHLRYVGNKRVAKFYHTGAEDSCNVDLHGAMNESYIFITIATGLTYGNEIDITPSIQAQTPTPTPTPTPTVNQPARTSGIEVPDFMTIGGGKLVYRKSQLNSDGSTYVFYDCYLNDDLRQDFVGQYLNLLKQYGFQFVQHDEKKYMSKRLQQNLKTETWIFQNSNYEQISIKRKRDKAKGEVSFDIKFTNGLHYAGNYAAPQRRAGGNAEGEMCWRCRGTGICAECGGSGRVSVWYGDEYVNEVCKECFGSSTCRWCGGSGKQ